MDRTERVCRRESDSSCVPGDAPERVAEFGSRLVMGIDRTQGAFSSIRSLSLGQLPSGSGFIPRLARGLLTGISPLVSECRVPHQFSPGSQLLALSERTSV